MTCSGFVLAGGSSTRMGRDKALLPYRGATLVEHVARLVSDAAGPLEQGAVVAIIGDVQRYSGLGYPVFADLVAGCGPLGGIYTALSRSATDWNLVVACDMPGLSAEALRELLRHALGSPGNCVLAAGPSRGEEPLCGVYHRRCLPALDRAIRDKRFKMRELVGELGAESWPVAPSVVANVNTPAEWSEFERQPR